ncbi:hypothetical protein JR316_0012914 [Psilocybe cubensis]|uniref:Uncharacterized protein n=2 Tax=Psilocybe cubensis TaxID=181762 RepID=A0A8H7XRL2_PSICU|nr:hypothetical protein JR316_0012914 [Psilocybe cubensis]KAH9474455.1 hypothetical protein JR316_0012914 [Psilocybe cubensis]
MPLIFEEDPDLLWKTQLRDRVMHNLDCVIQETNMAYKKRLSENTSASSDARYRMELDHRQNLENLQYMAEEELRAMIEQEERQRQENLRAPWMHPENADQSVVEEQIAILNQIRQQSMSRAVVDEECNTPYFQQGSSSTIFDEPLSPIPIHASPHLGAHDDYYTSTSPPIPAPIPPVQSPIDEEARLRAEKQAKLQEEFHKRAEAIMQRKKNERWISQQGWAEDMSSNSSATSASDQDVLSPTEASFEAAQSRRRISEQDAVDLVMFHEQRWNMLSRLPHLQWSDFPWPVLSLSTPKRKEDLTTEAVVEYIFAPLNIRDRPVVKDRLKELLRRWHPDRFDTKYLALIVDLNERERVREGAGAVTRILSDLLGKWNEL